MATTSSSSIMDRSSQSNPNQCQVKHLDWKVQVDFDNRVLKGEATYTYEKKVVGDSATTLDLDTSHLVIDSIKDPNNGNTIDYTLQKSITGKPHLGQKLSINIANNSNNNKLTIKYTTTNQCTAIQWLPPSQTSGKQYPYLFTQCQAIHARSIIPCQDLPGVKFTYTATVQVPSWSTCLMSAVLKSKNEYSIAEEGSSHNCKIYGYEQKVPISSYLLAMAVGHLAKRDLSPRVAIWSEPNVVKSAAYEFEQTEKFIQIAEKICGYKYVWNRYDLLCLPPSFPYGGMENPCLTFVTPTLLAGDRSLADVVAHEIAHSWTGNLVTNATWDHFWLNEGWTTWFQRKIMAAIHNDPKFLDFDALEGLKSLQDTVDGDMPKEFTKLVLDIGDNDPDESYSSVAYERGFNFLIYLERLVGSKAFEKFFQYYVKVFSYKTLTSDDFKDFFLGFFKDNAAVKDIDWDAWYYAPGMPPEIPDYDRSLAEASEKLASIWYAVDRSGRMLPTQNIKAWSSAQITTFLDALLSQTEDCPLQLPTIRAMDKLYNFSKVRNSEVLFRYCRLAIAAGDESILPVVCRFITTQGRMKFVRPLYRALHHSKIGRSVARQVFLENQDFYHPICAKMIASDLKERSKSQAAWMPTIGWTLVAAGLVTAGFIALRRKK